jgi:2-desacetyl-2-hydroxyethyl bacteriochlorophyllide A dehydrogenase
MERVMEAIVFPRPGEVEIREVTLPPCGPQELVVKTLYSLVSTGTELRVWSGRMESAGRFPLIPGYSVVGEVVEVGSEIADFAPGDLVSGRNSPLPVPGINELWGAQAAYHRYLTTGYDRVLKLPNSVTDPFQCLPGEIGGISWRGVKHADVTTGETALVIGQGLIGALSGAFLVLQGARVVVTDVCPSRLARANNWGVAATVNVRAADANEQLQTFLPEGADIIVEASAQPTAAVNALRFVRRRKTGGPGKLPRVVFQATYTDPIPVDLAHLMPGQSVGLYYPGDREPQDRGEVLEFCATGKLRSEDFVGETVPFRQAPSAYRALRDEPDAHFSVAFKW